MKQNRFSMGVVFFAIAVVLAAGLKGRAAEEGTERFLAVSEWEGSITHSLTEAGQKTEGECEYTWTANHGATATLRMLPVAFPGGGLALWQSEPGSLEYELSYSEHFHAQCPPDDPFEHSAGNGGDWPGNAFGLTVNVSNNTYEVSISASLPADLSFTGCQNCPLASGSEWWTGEPILNTLPASGMNLVGNASFDLTGCDSCGSYFATPIGVLGTGSLGGTLSVSWDLRPKLDLKVLVTPEDYDSWLPRANLSDPAKKGNHLRVRARLVTQAGQPTPVKAEKFRFTVTQRSNVPGICMNFPPQPQANQEPDLKFEHDEDLMPESNWAINGDGTQAETTEGEYSEATVTLSSFDFGAYGDMEVVGIVGGAEFKGKLEFDESRELVQIPKRAEDSKIADTWKNDNGVAAKPDDDDEETDPPGDEHTGDGLTLYEEYRGFVVDRRHSRDGGQRPDPRKKDLFVLAKAAGAREGARFLARVSGLNVISNLRQDELPANRVVNFNHSGDGLHAVDQHGLIVENGNMAGYSVALPENKTPDTPLSTDSIALAQNLDNFRSAISSLGIIVVGSTGYRARTVAHELGHGCAVWHHGEPYEDVKWNLISNGTNLVLREDGSLGSIDIVLKNEGGADITPTLAGFANAFQLSFPMEVELGVLDGRHSGDVTCLMRYETAQAYRARPAGFPSTRYWVGFETSGSVLCASTNGTSFNAPGWRPHSRYGGCAPNRGRCMHQICVNDKYNQHANHTR